LWNDVNLSRTTPGTFSRSSVLGLKMRYRFSPQSWEGACLWFPMGAKTHWSCRCNPRTKCERQRRRVQAAPHLRIDTKVRALSTVQFNLASAVGEVHRHAGLVAAAWSNSNSERFEAGYLQRTLHESLEGLLKTMQTVSQSKSSVPGSSSRHTTQQVRFLSRIVDYLSFFRHHRGN